MHSWDESATPDCRFTASTVVINTGAGFKTQPAVPFFADLKQAICIIAVPQFFTRGSSFELPLVLWVFYRVKIKLLKFFFQTNSLELF
ncbi:hypothetical protein, partial [Acinetobacter indicus]|uniref:hypothetical protein n=1 Tax=Acinetobacter indicus TaxID=756892 RepID=UPI001BC87824